MQNEPAAQSESAAHVARHAVAPQVYGEQSTPGGATHAPAPLQVEAATARSIEQEPGAHVVVLEG